MNSDQDSFAPYSAVTPTLKVLTRLRETGWPDPLTIAFLERVGVPAANTTRMMQTLRWLGLIEQNGTLTEETHQLRKASQQEYPELLADILRSAYHQVFMAVGDPAAANEFQLRDAFRGYQPQAQVQRMLVLFQALCLEAGLITEGPRRRASTVGHNGRSKPTSGPPVPRNGRQPTTAVTIGQVPDATPPAPATVPLTHKHPALRALFDQLPDTAWTEARRDQWIDAWLATLRWSIQVTPESEPQHSTYHGGDASRLEPTPEAEQEDVL